MRFLADECCPRVIVEALRSAGHDVDCITGSLAGTNDLDVARFALATDRVLITEDNDFGELAVRNGVSLPGLIVLAMHREPLARRVSRILDVATQFGETLRGQIVVVEPERQRFRPLLFDRDG